MSLFQKLLCFDLSDGLFSWNHQQEVSSSENFSHKAPSEPALCIWIMPPPPPYHLHILDDCQAVLLQMGVSLGEGSLKLFWVMKMYVYSSDLSIFASGSF